MNMQQTYKTNQSFFFFWYMKEFPTLIINQHGLGKWMLFLSKYFLLHQSLKLKLLPGLVIQK